MYPNEDSVGGAAAPLLNTRDKAVASRGFGKQRHGRSRRKIIEREDGKIDLKDKSLLDEAGKKARAYLKVNLDIHTDKRTITHIQARTSVGLSSISWLATRLVSPGQLTARSAKISIPEKFTITQAGAASEML